VTKFNWIGLDWIGFFQFPLQKKKYALRFPFLFVSSLKVENAARFRAAASSCCCFSAQQQQKRPREKKKKKKTSFCSSL
tara:strand:+ start:116 stop:352 length:237 start_codon:yes stop_codon:yes gene_type:complete